MAEYWPVLHARTESSPPFTIRQGSACYLVTPQIPERAVSVDATITIRRVVFRTLSHDQGWAHPIDPPITVYDESYTWFEAAIFRGLPSGAHENPGEAARLVDAKPSATEDVPFRVPNPFNADRAWVLQKNVRAASPAVMHEIVWDVDDEPDSTLHHRGSEALRPKPKKYEDTLNTTSPDGSGRGRGFARALQAGDGIAIFVKAQYPGWVNNVLGVDVQVFYSL